MRKILFLTSLLVILANAQTLTLQTTLQKIKENNQELSIAKLEEEIKALEAKAAQGLSYGSLDVNQYIMRSNDALSVFGYKLQSREATFADFGFKQFNGTNYTQAASDLNDPKARTLYTSNVTYTLPLYTGGKITHVQAMSDVLKQVATLDRETLKAEKVFEAKKTFFNLLLLKEHRYALQTIQKTMVRLEASAKAFHEEGYAKNVDMLEVGVRLSHIEQALLETEAQQALLLHYLSFLVNEPVEDVVGERFFEQPTSVASANSDMLALKKAEKHQEVARHQMAIQEGNFLPQVGLVSQYGVSDDQWMKDVDKHNAYTIGVQMKWNLFNGGSDKANLEKARVENLKATQNYQLAEQQMNLRLKQLQTTIKTLGSQVESLKKEVSLAHHVSENYQARYAQKLASMNDVLVKKSDELRAIMKLNDTQNRQYETIFEFEKLTTKEAL